MKVELAMMCGISGKILDEGNRMKTGGPKAKRENGNFRQQKKPALEE